VESRNLKHGQLLALSVVRYAMQQRVQKQLASLRIANESYFQCW